jgi:hypothetical protein
MKRFFESFRPLPPLLAPTALPGLIAFWSFDEDDANLALDGSGKGNHLVIEGAERTAGKRDKAMRFNGQSSLRNEKPIAIKCDSGFTIAAWFKISKTPDGSIMHLRRGPDNRESVHAGLKNASLEATLSAPGPRPDFPSRHFVWAQRRLRDDRWHHFALSMANGPALLRLCLNGEEFVGSGFKRHALKINMDEMTIGTNFVGLLDEICIFDRELTIREVRLLAGVDPDLEPKDRGKR